MPYIDWFRPATIVKFNQEEGTYNAHFDVSDYIITKSGIGAPAIVCIGRVALMRQCLDWIGQLEGAIVITNHIVYDIVSFRWVCGE